MESQLQNPEFRINPENFHPSLMLLLLSADFSKLTFSKNSFRKAIRVSNGLDPDQDRHYVGPHLGPLFA